MHMIFLPIYVFSITQENFYYCYLSEKIMTCGLLVTCPKSQLKDLRYLSEFKTCILYIKT